MKNRDYVPSSNTDFDIFQQILLGYIAAHTPGTATPWGYGFVRYGELTAKKNRWDAAWLIGKDENLRNHGDVVEMNEARADYEADIRSFVAEWIKNNSLITDEQRALMGITVDDNTPSPRPQIETQPIGYIKPLGGARMDAIFRAVADQTRPSMHPDADVVEMRYKIGGDAPTKIEDCSEITISTKAHFTMDLATADEGKKIYAFARWRNLVDNTKSGPWGTLITAVIA